MGRGSAKVSNEIARITLVKTKPGLEDDVRSRLTLRGDENSSAHTLFGIYDLLCVVVGEKARGRQLAVGTIDGIVAIREIVGFGLEADGAGIGSLRENTHQPFVVMTMLRVHHRQIQSQWDVEVDVLRSCMDFGAGPPPAIVFSMGHPDAILLSGHHSFESAIEWRRKARQHFANVDKNSSLLGYDPDSAGAAARNAPGDSASDTSIRGVGMRIAVPPRYRSQVGKAAKEMSAAVLSEPEVHHHPDADDLVLVGPLLPGKSAIDALDTFARIRKSLSDRIFDTCTFFPEAADDAATDSPGRLEPAEIKEEFRITGKDAESIVGIPHIGPQALRTYYALHNLFQDPFCRTAVQDLRRVHAALSTELKVAVGTAALHTTPPIRYDKNQLDLFDLIKTIVVDLQRGIHQRLYGVNTAIHHIDAPLSNPIGGIHKLLQAIGALPRFVFAVYEDRWPRITEALRTGPDPDRFISWAGYVVSTDALELSCSKAQVVEVPKSFLLHPQSWTMVLHEAAHALFGANGDVLLGGLPPMLMEDIRASLEDLAGIGGLDMTPDFATELAADVVAFNFSPTWKPMEWAKAYWRTMSACVEYSAGSKAQHPLLRSLLVYVGYRCGWLVDSRSRELSSPGKAAFEYQSELTRWIGEAQKRATDSGEPSVGTIPTRDVDAAFWAKTLLAEFLDRNSERLDDLLYSFKPLLVEYRRFTPWTAAEEDGRESWWKENRPEVEGRAGYEALLGTGSIEDIRPVPWPDLAIYWAAARGDTSRDFRTRVVSTLVMRSSALALGLADRET